MEMVIELAGTCLKGLSGFGGLSGHFLEFIKLNFISCYIRS